VNLDRLQRAPNIAIIGSSSPVGKELKDLIQESGLPVGNIKLTDTEEYAGLLQEFAGQIQITQVISPSAFENIDIAFFTCSSEIMRAFSASGASIPEVAIDLTQTGREGTLFLNGLTSLSLISPIRDSAYFISPHPSVIVLARILSGLHRRFAVESVSVTILEPASERGAAGIDELQEQTVRLLNFQPAGSKLFKGQIAFNVLPETEAANGTENLIRGQLAAILGNSIPLSLYYAYGIRNSFGLGFDSVTGNLWDTENGPGNSDEINLAQPGFNSGWQEVMGLVNDEDGFDQSDLVNFDGKGVYRDPELVWLNTAGPTAILFLTSDKLGPQYLNDMFVADVHNGRIYHFDLTSDRTHLVLPPPLAGKVIKNPRANGLDQIMFGEEFGGITDLKVGPDGYLYVVSVGLGKIFRILPA